MRPILRDVFWATVTVAVSAGWWIDHDRCASRVERLENRLELMEKYADELRSIATMHGPSREKRVELINGAVPRIFGSPKN